MKVELHITRKYTPDPELMLRAVALAADVSVEEFNDALRRAFTEKVNEPLGADEVETARALNPEAN